MFYSIMYQDKVFGGFGLCYDELGRNPFIVKSFEQAKDHLNSLRDSFSKDYPNLEYKIVKIENTGE